MTQQPLPLEPAAEPVPPVVDQRVPFRERPRLTWQSVQILERLRRGPVTNRELAQMFPPGAAWRTRLSDCRLWLERFEGKTIKSADCGGGLWSYEIVEA